MFNYTFKIVSIFGYKNPKKLLESIRNSNSIPLEVKKIVTQSIDDFQFFKSIVKKQNNKLIHSLIWNNNRYEIKIIELIEKNKSQYEIQINPIPKPTNYLVLGTDLNHHIPKKAIIPNTNNTYTRKGNILLHARKIYNQPNENYFSFDKNGNVNFYSYGDKLNAPQNIPFGLVNRVFELHNHPLQPGHAVNTFSDTDIIAFLEESNLKQSYIVGSTGILFILIKTKPINLTKSLENKILKDFNGENIGDLAIDIYNDKYALTYRNKSDKERVYKLELTKYEAFAKLIKKYGLKFIISHI
ncbi:MAG: hypothetical protein PHI91_03565 [Candidatus Pacebacteria bacterium]|nr:hypothetical protein [Candidatus Paceibacterota bacterium]MDD2757541.1 hypothetical protein [Candidatus Paceibacterota bacterium]MDD3970236.1 hypothetical protein [Candidatus Paceibacterota bacterium]